MEEWKEYKLGDVCKTISDTYKGEAQYVILINTSDVLEGKCLNHQKTPNKNLKGQFKKTFKRNDILYSEIRPANKRYAYIDFEPSDYIASTKLMVIRHNEKILPLYLFYILKSQEVVEELQMLAESRSGTFPQITFDEVANMKIKLPSIEQQNRILGVLKSFDDKIEVNRRINDNFTLSLLLLTCFILWLLKLRNDNLEHQARTLYKSWFIDFEPYKDIDFEETEIGRIPKDLLVKRVSEIPHTIETGRRPKGGVGEITSGVPSVGAEHVKGLGNYDYSKTKYITEEYAASLKTGKVNGYELLIYKDGGKPGYFIPNYSIFGEGYPFEECFLNEHVFKLDFDDKGYNAFCYFYFWTDYVMNYLNAQGGKAAIPGINRQDIENIQIFAPENELVKRFGDIVLPSIRQILFNCKESRRLSQLRDALLPRLMSGELKVNEIEMP